MYVALMAHYVMQNITITKLLTQETCSKRYTNKLLSYSDTAKTV